MFYICNITDYDMKERILKFLQAENISSSQFAELIGVQPSSISHIVSGRNNPSLDFVVKMLVKYPEIDPDWLLFGSGEMFRSEIIPSEGLSGDSKEVSPRPEGQTLFSDAAALKKEDTLPLKDQDSDQVQSVRAAGSVSNAGRTPVRVVVYYSDKTYEQFSPS